MDKIRALIQACKTGLDSNPQAVKDAEAELAEIERTMDAQSRRYANLAEEHRDLAKREREQAHKLAICKRMIEEDRGSGPPPMPPEVVKWLKDWPL